MTTDPSAVPDHPTLHEVTLREGVLPDRQVYVLGRGLGDVVGAIRDVYPSHELVRIVAVVELSADAPFVGSLVRDQIRKQHTRDSDLRSVLGEHVYGRLVEFHERMRTPLDPSLVADAICRFLDLHRDCTYEDHQRGAHTDAIADLRSRQ